MYLCVCVRVEQVLGGRGVYHIRTNLLYLLQLLFLLLSLSAALAHLWAEIDRELYNFVGVYVFPHPPSHLHCSKWQSSAVYIV